MWLRATEAMSVKLPDIDMIVDFAVGEDMRTEISAKFTPEAWLRAGGRASTSRTAGPTPTATTCSPCGPGRAD